MCSFSLLLKRWNDSVGKNYHWKIRFGNRLKWVNKQSWNICLGIFIIYIYIYIIFIPFLFLLWFFFNYYYSLFNSLITAITCAQIYVNACKLECMSFLHKSWEVCLKLSTSTWSFTICKLNITRLNFALCHYFSCSPTSIFAHDLFNGLGIVSLYSIRHPMLLQVWTL
jgi:hypothetical protein